MTKEQITNRNILLLNLHNIGISAIFILPVFLLYYQDVIGIGFRELMIGEAIFSAVVLLMEVPSGWLSDVWKRKHTLILGSAINMVGFALLWNADSFLDACIAQGLLGVGVSLNSGTVQAFLYDTLLDQGREDEFSKREGTRFSYGFYSIAAASAVGGFLYAIDPHLAMGLTGFGYAFAIVCAALLVEPARHKRAAEKHPIADMIETMRYALHGHREVAMLIFAGAVMFCGTKVLLWTQQPYYIANDVPAAWFGVLGACGFLISAVAGQFSHILPAHWPNRYVLGGLLAFEVLICAIAGIFIGWVGVVLILCGYLVYGLGQPRMQAALNKRVDSTRRATILSTASLMVHVMAIPAMTVFGILEGSIGIDGALLALGGFIALLGGPFMIGLIRAEKRLVV